MTIREKLHRLVDELSEVEVDDALRVLVKRREDPVIAAFRDAPEDDEPWTDEDEAAMAESRADVIAGRLIPSEEIKREFGYE